MAIAGRAPKADNPDHLLLGPKRYKDLLEGLPGIGTNLLADRLHELEALGVVERAVLPPPAGSSVYRLTEVGQALEPVVAAIGRWGAQFLGPVQDTLLPSAYFVAMRHVFRPELAVGKAETFELRIGDRVFEVRIDQRRCTTREGLASNPDVIMIMDVKTLNALLLEGLSPEEAMASGRLEIQGDPGALDRFVRVSVPAAPSRVTGGAPPLNRWEVLIEGGVLVLSGAAV